MRQDWLTGRFSFRAGSVPFRVRRFWAGDRLLTHTRTSTIIIIIISLLSFLMQRDIFTILKYVSIAVTSVVEVLTHLFMRRFDMIQGFQLWWEFFVAGFTIVRVLVESIQHTRLVMANHWLYHGQLHSAALNIKTTCQQPSNISTFWRCFKGPSVL